MIKEYDWYFVKLVIWDAPAKLRYSRNRFFHGDPVSIYFVRNKKKQLELGNLCLVIKECWRSIKKNIPNIDLNFYWDTHWNGKYTITEIT